HVVGLLARVGGAGAGLGIELGALKVDDLGAGAVRVEVRVARRDGDVGRLGLRALARRGQVEVVVDELAPGVDPIGQEPVVGQAAVGRVGGERGADEASAGAVGAGEGGDAIGVGGGRDAQQVHTDAAPKGVGQVVAGAVDGIEAGRQKHAVFEGFDLQ